MSSKVIYTLNQNNFLTPHVRASHQYYADKIGAEYVVLKEAWGSRKDTFGMKMQLHLLEGERMMWLDADILIRSDCPDIMDGDSFKAVPCYQNGMPPNQDIDPFYFNGGLMIWSRKHNAIWYNMDKDEPQRAQGPMQEQNAQNKYANAYTDVLLMDETFNRLGPATWEATEMTDYIMHWARWNNYRKGRVEKMNAMKWQLSRTDS